MLWIGWLAERLLLHATLQPYSALIMLQNVRHMSGKGAKKGGKGSKAAEPVVVPMAVVKVAQVMPYQMLAQRNKTASEVSVADGFSASCLARRVVW